MVAADRHPASDAVEVPDDGRDGPLTPRPEIAVLRRFGFELVGAGGGASMRSVVLARAWSPPPLCSP